MTEKQKRIQNLRKKINSRYETKNVSHESKHIVVPEYDPHFLNGVGYYTKPKHGHVHPFYMTNADYNTDSASYYDYLAKYNELLKALIVQVNDNTANIDLIFDMLDDLQQQIDNIIEIINDILNQLENIFTMSESSQLFQKSIHDLKIPSEFNVNDYSLKEFAQMYIDYVNLYLEENYENLPDSGDTIIVDITSDMGIPYTKLLNLLKHFFGDLVQETDFKIIAKIKGNDFTTPSQFNVFSSIDGYMYMLTSGEFGDLSTNNTKNTDLFKSTFLWADGFFVDGEKFIPEENRTLLVFEGNSYLQSGVELNLAMQGYTTAAAQKVNLRFGEHNGTGYTGKNICQHTITNGLSKLGYENDRFYSWQTVGMFKSDVDTVYTKSFDFNYLESVIHGHSAIPNNGFGCYAIEIVIYASAWKDETMRKKVDLSYLEDYELMSCFDLKGDEKEIYVSNESPSKCYNIYNLSDNELQTFKTQFNKAIFKE